MRDYDCPGNVRELRNTVDRCVAMCRGSEILPEHLPAQALILSARQMPRAQLPLHAWVREF